MKAINDNTINSVTPNGPPNDRQMIDTVTKANSVANLECSCLNEDPKPFSLAYENRFNCRTMLHLDRQGTNTIVSSLPGAFRLSIDRNAVYFNSNISIELTAAKDPT